MYFSLTNCPSSSTQNFSEISTSARDAAAISLVEIVEAMEGPLGMTECSVAASQCGIEHSCGVRANWRRINDVVADALRGVSLAQMLQPAAAPPRKRIDMKLAKA